MCCIILYHPFLVPCFVADVEALSKSIIRVRRIRYGAGCQSTAVKNLQRLQNRAAHMIQRKATTEEAFQMLGWVNLETQINIHKRILVFKCLNSLVPPYLCHYFVRNRSILSHNARNRNDWFIYLCLNKAKRNETKDKWFLEFPSTRACAGMRLCRASAICKVVSIN